MSLQCVLKVPLDRSLTPVEYEDAEQFFQVSWNAIQVEALDYLRIAKFSQDILWLKGHLEVASECV